MSDIKGTTRVCGLIGNPVEHSISPVIHNTLAKMCGMDMAYVNFKVERGAVKCAVDGAYALNVLGMNVTVPHKHEVLDALTDIDPLAGAIGAVNTLVRTDSGYKGYNTDIYGLHRELMDAGIDIKGSEIVILGAGGAARAIAFLCAREDASKVWILNRTDSKAKLLADEVNTVLHKDTAEGMNITDHRKLTGSNYVVIQTTNVGLYPHSEEAVIEDKSFYEKVKLGVDIIYNPIKTKFMRLTEENSRGAKAYNGLKMLLYQGISAYELWYDMKVDDKTVVAVYERMKKEMKILE